MHTTLDRRTLLRRAAGLAVGATVAPALIPLAQAAGSCVEPDSEALRVSVNYVAVAADPAQNCSSCGFFAADESTAGCGYCQILSGAVDATGHCDSWSPME